VLSTKQFFFNYVCTVLQTLFIVTDDFIFVVLVPRSLVFLLYRRRESGGSVNTSMWQCVEILYATLYFLDFYNYMFSRDFLS
jgi:hypothetical protein